MKKIYKTPKSQRDAFKAWRQRKLELGYKSYLCFGPPELIEAVKALVKEYRDAVNKSND